MEVDHVEGIDWEFLIDLIFERVLVHPDKLQTLCDSDHREKSLEEMIRRAKKLDDYSKPVEGDF